MEVPNAPCGVERQKTELFMNLPSLFLMHRVELKEQEHLACPMSSRVPNAPCGVESVRRTYFHNHPSLFLMHRVELKDTQTDRLGAKHKCS